MEITIRPCRQADKEEVLAIENATTSKSRYLEEVWEGFVGDPTGPMLVAQVDGEMVGLAKYTVLYDGTAWLEGLRVKPSFQHMGVGRRFYEEFVRLSKEKGIQAMCMFTGAAENPSSALARKFGLETKGLFRGATLPLSGVAPPSVVPNFLPVSPQRAGALLGPMAERWKGYLVMDGTFYHMNPSLYEGLAQEGKVYEEPESGSFLVLGNRFLEKRSIQIGIMGGDLQRCLDFAKAKGLEKGVPNLVYTFPLAEETLQKYLEENGFVLSKMDIQVMEGPVA